MSEDVHRRLLDAGYREVERWRISEVLGFVRRELDARTWVLQGAFAALAFAAAVGVTYAYWDVADGARLVPDVVAPFGAGCLAMLVAVVPHELLHGLAYKLTGAPRVAYGADFRKLVFHASAPDHVLTARQLYFVALVPLVVLTAVMAVALAVSGGWWWWFWFGLVLTHTQGCLGDLALVSYFVRHRARGEWITYDAGATEEFVLMVRTPEAANTNADARA